ncbi:hypothetical protein JNUCC83_04700 [Vagococcus sp. JNUCC 83]
MPEKQDIVPVTFDSKFKQKNDGPQSTTNVTKPKVTIRVKRDQMDITIYNGCNNYILNAALGVLNSHAN